MPIVPIKRGIPQSVKGRMEFVLDRLRWIGWSVNVIGLVRNIGWDTKLPYMELEPIVKVALKGLCRAGFIEVVKNDHRLIVPAKS